MNEKPEDVESQPLLDEESKRKAHKLAQVLDEIYEIRVFSPNEMIFLGFFGMAVLIITLSVLYFIVSLLVALIMSPNFGAILTMMLFFLIFLAIESCFRCICCIN